MPRKLTVGIALQPVPAASTWACCSWPTTRCRCTSGRTTSYGFGFDTDAEGVRRAARSGTTLRSLFVRIGYKSADVRRHPGHDLRLRRRPRTLGRHSRSRSTSLGAAGRRVCDREALLAGLSVLGRDRARGLDGARTPSEPRRAAVPLTTVCRRPRPLALAARRSCRSPCRRARADPPLPGPAGCERLPVGAGTRTAAGAPAGRAAGRANCAARASRARRWQARARTGRRPPRLAQAQAHWPSGASARPSSRRAPTRDKRSTASTRCACCWCASPSTTDRSGDLTSVTADGDFQLRAAADPGRCDIDPPPHDRAYFESHLQGLSRVLPLPVGRAACTSRAACCPTATRTLPASATSPTTAPAPAAFWTIDGLESLVRDMIAAADAGTQARRLGRTSPTTTTTTRSPTSSSCTPAATGRATSTATRPTTCPTFFVTLGEPAPLISSTRRAAPALDRVLGHPRDHQPGRLHRQHRRRALPRVRPRARPGRRLRHHHRPDRGRHLGPDGFGHQPRRPTSASTPTHGDTTCRGGRYRRAAAVARRPGTSGSSAGWRRDDARRPARRDRLPAVGVPARGLRAVPARRLRRLRPRPTRRRWRGGALAARVLPDREPLGAAVGRRADCRSDGIGLRARRARPASSSTWPAT